ncbi:putative FolC bifunctional protein [[Clostridium] ultunense Esp]|nr:putative FolC bifunctional protein [[Clostridium] ultunense Esp]
MSEEDFIYASYMAALPHLRSKRDEEVRKPEFARILLDKLGSPDRGIPVILVTGSKGKGSVSRMIAFLLESMGFRVGLFTSPHLLDFRERIRVNGLPIPKDAFHRHGERVKEELEKIPVRPLQGEYIGPIAVSLALAFLHFQEEKVEVAVLEAGRGGLMDETNQVLHQVAVITPLFEEHLDQLGPTLADVVRHKLGIIREGVERVYIGRQGEEALKEIKNWKEKRGISPPSLIHWREYGRDFSLEKVNVTLAGTEATVRLGEERLPPILLPLLGEYQGENLALALRVVKDWTGEKGKRIVEKSDFGRFRWPGRGEILGRNPLIILDGGIHRSSAASLSRLVASLPHSRLHVLLSLPKDKDVEGVLQVWAETADLIVTTETTNPSLSYEAPYEELLQKAGGRGGHLPDPQRALVKTIEGLDGNGILVLMGTQSFVADMLRLLGRSP